MTRPRILGLALLAGLLPLSALAFVPPSFYLVKKLAEKRGGFKTIKVVTLVKELKDRNPSGLQFRQVSLFDEKSGTLRSWALDAKEKPVFYQERKLQAMSGGGVPPGPVADFLLFQSQVVPVARALVQAGVPVRTEAELSEMKEETERRAAESTVLKRWNGAAAWVIGREKNSPQLWIEKDGFLPIRLLLPNSGDLEIEFNQHRSVSGYLYPHEVVLLLGGSPVLREEVVAVTPNPGGTGGLPILSSTGLLNEDIDGDLKDLLKQFYLHVR